MLAWRLIRCVSEFNFQVRYKSDCVELYGRILDNHNVVSSIQGSSKRETEQTWNELYPNEPYDFPMKKQRSFKIESEQTWNKLYPNEPYDFDLPSGFFEKVSGDGKYTQYDLLSAVQRQVPFFYQVSDKAVMLNFLYTTTQEI